jgi:Carboxypeptidase regulatory-like domain
MMRTLSRSMFVIACVALLPSAVRAQSAIGGIVKDVSGAVLPGVNVEASSDVLIEKSRSVTTDGAGQYKIVDLRPGVYIVTFSLSGFQTVKRQNVELPTDFTATINAEMKVGAIEESVTVSAVSPVVDVQSASHMQVLNREAMDEIPTGRTIQGLGQLIVGVSLSLPDTAGARGMQQTYMSTHGQSAANNTVMVDGMMVNGLMSDGAVQSYFNDAMNQEVAYQTSGIGAETSAGGVRLNMIPKEGGTGSAAPSARRIAPANGRATTSAIGSRPDTRTSCRRCSVSPPVTRRIGFRTSPAAKAGRFSGTGCGSSSPAAITP